MRGDQSKALIIISKARGWDPTEISGAGSIANFDKSPQDWKLSDDSGQWSVRNLPPDSQSVGKLPQGTPDSFPDATGPVLKERVSWNAPKPSK